MLVYRIGHKDYVNRLTASGLNGRWTSAGKMVIYCAASIELAFLENMIRRQGVGFNYDYKIAVIDIPDRLRIDIIAADSLETGWRDFKDYSKCQVIGDEWYDNMKIPVLKVPSAVLPQASNFVLNTNHPDFKAISIVEVTDLVPDERIEHILKSHKR